MKFRINLCISAAMVALMFVGCKPTEKNYKAAYDAALAKRQEAAAEQMRPATGLLSDEGPQLRVVDGDSIYVLRETLRLPDGSKVPGKWALGIGVYKMDTNAKAAVSAIRGNGFPDACVAKAPGGRFYSIAAIAGTLDSVRIMQADFRRAFPEYPYVGLPGAPVLISY